MPKQRGDTGQYVETVTLKDVLGIFDTVDGPAVVTSADVAEATGLSRDSARRKLEQLRDEGRVDRRESAGRILYWRLEDADPDADPGAARVTSDSPADRQPATADAARRESDPSPGAVSPPDDRDAGHAPDERQPAGDERDLATLVDAIADDVLPGSGAKLEARRAALHAVVEYLREQGTAEPADFRRDVYPDHPGQYTEGKDPARSWWKNAMYKGLRELADRSDAVEKADTTGTWRYVEGG